MSQLSDFELARLPFKEAQAGLFAATDSRPVFARLGWHGQDLDPRLGSYALVAAHGPCAGLVGRRIRVQTAARDRKPVFAYVILAIEDAILDPVDITLTRRVFMELALASATYVQSIVQTVVSSGG